MPTLDPRIDAYIAASSEGAQPILEHIRAIVHDACPDVEETMKSSFPHFQYKGMLCSMASFKGHCAFGFWKGELLIAAEDDKGKEAMGQFGRITSVKDLPAQRILSSYIKKAMKLNDDGVKPPRPRQARHAERTDGAGLLHRTAGADARRAGMARRRQIARLEIREVLT